MVNIETIMDTEDIEANKTLAEGFALQAAVDNIDFDNANEIVYYLVMQKPLVATALLDELLYWRTNTSRI